jgi:Xaa-Pro aminopeptidase
MSIPCGCSPEFQNLEKDANIGVDPWCVSIETAQQWQQIFKRKSQNLVLLEENLVDKIWIDRPPQIIDPVAVHPIQYAGRTSEDKLAELRVKLSDAKAGAIILTALDEVENKHLPLHCI